MKKEEISEYDGIRQERFYKAAIKYQEEIEEYQNISPAYQHYLQICGRIADLIKGLSGDMQDDRVYMAIFSYLYRNGYLSCNNHFEFGINPKEIACNMGLSVITGKGVCRNIASFFKDILMAIKGSTNGIMVVGTNINENQDIVIPFKELPKEFDMNIAETEEEVSQNIAKKEFIPNHTEVIVMDTSRNNDSYSLMLYDPTNIRITRIDYRSINYQSDIADRKSIDFRCGIWDINTHLTTTDERREFVERFGKIAKRLEGSKHQNYGRKDLELILEYTRRQCNLHKSEIEEFYRKNMMGYSILKKQADIYIEKQKKSTEKKVTKNR